MLSPDNYLSLSFLLLYSERRRSGSVYCCCVNFTTNTWRVSLRGFYREVLAHAASGEPKDTSHSGQCLRTPIMMRVGKGFGADILNFLDILHVHVHGAILYYCVCQFALSSSRGKLNPLLYK
jgi:hypothetical protein